MSDGVAAAASITKALYVYLCIYSFWRFYSRWQLQRAVAERSHLVFLVVFYLMIAVVFFILFTSLYIYTLSRSRKQPRWQW